MKPVTDVPNAWSVKFGVNPLAYAIAQLASRPQVQPASSALGWNQLVHRPRTNAGKIWSISAPPSSWKSMAYGTGTKKMKSNAKAQIASVNTLAMSVSTGERSGENSRNTLLANKFAAPMHMMAAGTSAPITIAASATPANQSGK